MALVRLSDLRGLVLLPNVVAHHPVPARPNQSPPANAIGGGGCQAPLSRVCSPRCPGGQRGGAVCCRRRLCNSAVPRVGRCRGSGAALLCAEQVARHVRRARGFTRRAGREVKRLDPHSLCPGSPRPSGDRQLREPYPGRLSRPSCAWAAGPRGPSSRSHSCCFATPDQTFAATLRAVVSLFWHGACIWHFRPWP